MKPPRCFILTLVFAVVLALSLTACGGASDDELEKAREQGAQEQQDKQKQQEQEDKQEELEKKIEKLEKQAKKKKSDSSSSSSGSGSAGYSGTTCSGGLSVGANTTCSFAENVRSEWAAAGGGSVTIDVYSPVTGATYTMRCTAGTTTVCRGGNNATVYIR